MFLQPEQKKLPELQHIQSTPFGSSFSMTNSWTRNVLVRLLSIEMKDDHGWQVYTNFAPGTGNIDPHASPVRPWTEPQAVWHATVTAPTSTGTWRLRVEVFQQAGVLARLLEYIRLSRVPGSPVRTFSFQQFQSFRSYQRPIELVSTEID
jgi:hypothetical protein